MATKQKKSGMGQRGYSIIELMIVMGVLVIVVQGFSVFMANTSRHNVQYREKNYAMQKAVQMMEELRSIVNRKGQSVSVLDAYRDGWSSPSAVPPNIPFYKFTLTTKRHITHDSAGNTLDDWVQAVLPISANPVVGGGYRFVRHVEVAKDATDPAVRKVWVRVYRAASNSGAAAETLPGPRPQAADRPLAEVFTVVRSFGEDSPPAQVMDVYLVALENVPGWWARTSRLQTLMQNTIISVQARNQGLRIREHWITRMSYGRDLEYTPEINKAALASAYGFAKTYIYPGFIRYDGNEDDYYYSPDWFSARINLDGAVQNNAGYALADQFNHAMRYPDELNLYQIHRRVAENTGSAPPEISLRMLLEKMNNADPDLKNSMVINLHGEMVPVLPLRNYADAAQDPQWYWNDGPLALTWTTARSLRAVSHSERLRYDTATQPQAVRVYAYDMNPATASEDALISEVTLFIPGANTGNLSKVERLQGSSSVPYHWHSYASGSWAASAGKLHDGPSPDNLGSTWVAEDYTTPQGRSGLRIQLFGVSPTARAYWGSPWVAP